MIPLSKLRKKWHSIWDLMLNLRIIMSDQRFSFLWVVGVLLFEASPLIRETERWRRGPVRQTTSTWPAFLGSAWGWQPPVPPCWRSRGDFHRKWNSPVTWNACGPQWPNGSLPGLAKQPGGAAYPRHLEQPCLLYPAVQCCVCMNVFLTVCLCFNSSAFTADRHRKRKLLENSSLNSKLLKVNVSN